MTASRDLGNVHGTAIVLGTRGFLIVGPSGAGKSTVALALMAQARRAGRYAALVADDQVLLSAVGDRVIARAPETIRSLLEIRAADIVSFETVDHAVLDYAIHPVRASDADRLPGKGGVHALTEGSSLPALRLPYGDGQDVLAILDCLLPQNSSSGA